MCRNYYQPYTKNYKINYQTMASSTLGLTLNQAPFPLIKEVLAEESTFVEISVKVQVGQGNNAQWEKHTTKICKIDHLDKELMMNSIIEFEKGPKIPGTSGRSVPCRLGQRPSGQGQFGCWVPQNPQRVHLLRHLNKLMSKLPGANDTLLYDEGALKIELFKMMLSNWQINFNNTGLNIMDNACT
jgi:hypothetical protein